MFRHESFLEKYLIVEYLCYHKGLIVDLAVRDPHDLGGGVGVVEGGLGGEL